MDEIHYLISDASKKVDVEAHVLRYWEEELDLDIPRNEMGHRYYTDLHIRLFRQIKNLKEKGYQLKAIKHALTQVLEKEGRMELSDEILERDMDAALKEFREEDKPAGLAEVKEGASALSMEEKMAQFQQIMNLIIGRALEVNNEKLSQDISALVNEKMGRELEYLLKDSDQKAEERFRQLDETLRAVQKESQDEAAAAKIPFFKKKRFGRSGKKLWSGKK
ncbi:MAG TPA: helix-turn-helix domain-containing protein [Candidatus Enterocloster excrementipullorum]|uniref:Helix-turn-helix domain-containing protein n=1 Tax=Candidatus Enterocloster excrementipullorum TaxID=2838559 RepID=A0A9D2MYP7_9FIRM|nr:helix-turn-helix domain-containing protein [Candidatus Enterocloster excrementipullorum]